jgi:hypothetical protein
VNKLYKKIKIATFLPTAAGQFCLLSYWMAAGIWAFPTGFPIPEELPRGFPTASGHFPAASGHFPAAFLHPLSISQRLSNNL